MSYHGLIMIYTLIYCIVSVSFFLIAEASESKNPLIVCQSNDLEPSILDIFRSIVPETVVKQFDSWKGRQTPEQIDLIDSLASVFSAKFPLSTLVSNGRYNVSFGRSDIVFGFNSITLLQNPPWTSRWFCNSFREKLYYLSFLCDCKYGYQYDGDDAQFSGYCVSKPCTDRDFQRGSCDILVDPISSSCIIIDPVHYAHSDSYKLQAAVQYDQIIPTYSSLLHHLVPPPVVDDSIGAIYREARQLADIMISAVPFYLINFIIGLFIVTYAEDLLEYDSMIVVMKTVYGIVVAFLLLMYVIYRYYLHPLSRTTPPP
jgi:hypothetical protein